MAKFIPDDAHLASELTELWKGQYAYFWETWHKYNTGYWERLESEEMQRDIREFMVRQRERGVEVNTRELRSLERMYRLDCFTRPDLVDVEKSYLNLRNGFLNLNTLQLEEHRREVIYTWQLNFDYDPKATCPTFIRYLETTFVQPDGKPDQEVICLVQEALGYSLTADTSRKASFWLYGVSNSGKSKMITLIRNMLGNMHATIDLNQLATNKFMLANIAGKRAVTCTEAAVGLMIPDSIYKILVGGSDEIFADVKNKKGLTFVPQCKTWWAMNDTPRTTDRSGAVLNRVQIIPFTRAIPEHLRDVQLDGKLYQERSGILNWALRGLLRLNTFDEFTSPAISERLREEYKMLNDTEATFLRETYDSDPEGMIQASELYRGYKSWCEDNGFSRKNMNQVARDWERLGLVKAQRHEANYWKGIREKKSFDINKLL